MYIYKTRLTSNEIFSPSNKIHREVGRAKGLSAPPAFHILRSLHYNSITTISTKQIQTILSDSQYWYKSH